MLSVLLVDDQPDLLDNLRLTLEMAGYETRTAANGFEALAVLRSEPVALILSDIVMPDMDGYQLHEHLRTNPHWTAIPFVFLRDVDFCQRTKSVTANPWGLTII